MRSPAFPFYPSDFLTGTDEMSSAEVGLYIRMLSYQWLRPEGGLPSDPSKIIRLTRWESDELPPAVMRKFTASEDGLLRNPRLEQERQKRESYQKQQTELANRRWGHNGHVAENPETQMKPAAAEITSPQPSFVPPTEDEVLLRCSKSGIPEIEGRKFFNYWDEMGWKNKGGPVKDWHKRLARWKLDWESKGRPGTSTNTGDDTAPPKSDWAAYSKWALKQVHR